MEEGGAGGDHGAKVEEGGAGGDHGARLCSLTTTRIPLSPENAGIRFNLE